MTKVIQCGMRRVAVAVVLISSLAVADANLATAGVPRIETSGSRLWLARFDNRAEGFDSATSVATSPDGSKVFVTGSSWSGNLDDYATIAYSASTGRELWRTRYGGGDGADADPKALAVSPSGNLVFVISSLFTARFDGWATVAYDASTGARAWMRRYPADPSGLAVSPDGATVFVVGRGKDAHGSTDYATVAYDVASGDHVWVKSYGRGGTDPSGESASAVTVSPDGEQVFVSGSSAGDLDADYATLAYDARTGSRTWLTRRRSAGYDKVTAIGASPDGAHVFVTGNTLAELPQWRTSATVAYDASTGDEIWEVGSDASATPMIVTSLAVSNDSGIVYITGKRLLGDWYDIVTTAYEVLSGSMLWGRRSSGVPPGTSTIANAIVVSPDGSAVYVTGGTGPDRNPDYATVAYEAVTGAELWVRRFQGPRDGFDMARSIAMAPDGTKVLVTGESDGSTSRDFVTLAYSA